MSVYFTADQHLNHKRIVELANRPFSSTKEMNEHLVSAWNAVVKPNDIVYQLGDFMFTPNKGGEEGLREYLRRLNGEIRMLLGNHDDRRLLERVLGPTWMPRGLHRIRHEGERVVICHYSLRTWEGQHYGAWHLFGHSHGALSPFGKSVDVGVDADFIERPGVPWGTPYSFDEIKTFMDSRHIAVPEKHQKASRR